MLHAASSSAAPVRGVRPDHAKLIAAEPEHKAAVSDDLLSAPGEGDQEVIAGIVPEPVIDRLEFVDVDDPHRCRFAELRTLVAAFDDVVHDAAVRKAGELVDPRLPVPRMHLVKREAELPDLIPPREPGKLTLEITLGKPAHGVRQLGQRGGDVAGKERKDDQRDAGADRDDLPGPVPRPRHLLPEAVEREADSHLSDLLPVSAPEFDPRDHHVRMPVKLNTPDAIGDIFQQTIPFRIPAIRGGVLGKDDARCGQPDEAVVRDQPELGDHAFCIGKVEFPDRNRQGRFHEEHGLRDFSVEFPHKHPVEDVEPRECLDQLGGHEDDKD